MSRTVTVDDRTALVLGMYCHWLADRLEAGESFALPGFDRAAEPLSLGPEGRIETIERLRRYRDVLMPDVADNIDSAREDDDQG